MATNKLSNANLAQAVQIIKAHKAFQKTFNESPAQTKVVVALVLPLFTGLPFYSFLSYNPLGQLVGYSLTSFIIGWIIYGATQSPAEKWAVIIAFLVGICFWFYIFIKNYRQEQADKKTGKKSYVCSPTGTCQTDGSEGPYNGLKKYVFNPPSSKEKPKHKIPAKQFDIRVSDRFTYMFWLKIDYFNWKKSRFYGKDKIILMKGNGDISASDLAVWALPVENAIQFDINSGDNTKPASLSAGFPFDKWVHYAVVVNGKVVELYKNATLEQSAILDKTMSLKRSPLYLGRTANNDYHKFPGQLLYLSYNNDNLTPGDIYDIYKKEYSKVSGMDLDSHTMGGTSSEKCPTEKCPSENTVGTGTFDIASVINTKDMGIQYADHSKITLPSTQLDKDGLLDKYKKYYS